MRPASACLAIVLAAAMPAACGFTDTGTRVRDFVANEGAKAYDEGLANAEFFLCRAASVGSVQRRYGRTAETAEAWRVLCFGEGSAAADVIRQEAPPSQASP
jgi:hypothetical protein